MAVPVGITALELNTKSINKHYLQNILLSYTKAVCITSSSLFTMTEEQCRDNNS